MLKFFVGLVATALIGYIGYHKYTDVPLNARSTIELGIEQVRATAKLSPDQEQLLRVQLALSDYISNHAGDPPDSLDQLIPKYFDTLPSDPSTGSIYEYVKVGKSYRLGAQAKDAPIILASASSAATGGKKKGLKDMASPELELVNPNEMVHEEFTYDPSGKRDPFEAFDFSPTATFDSNTPPLQRYTLGQLKVTAILADSRGEMSAIVEDATGRGYTVRVGTKIGTQNGEVVSIEKETINIIETHTDFTGKETKVPVVMRIPPREDPSQGGYVQY